MSGNRHGKDENSSDRKRHQRENDARAEASKKAEAIHMREVEELVDAEKAWLAEAALGEKRQNIVNLLTYLRDNLEPFPPRSSFVRLGKEGEYNPNVIEFFVPLSKSTNPNSMITDASFMIAAVIKGFRFGIRQFHGEDIIAFPLDEFKAACIKFGVELTGKITELGGGSSPGSPGR